MPHDSDVFILSTYNESTSVLEKSLMRTLKNKIHKKMSANISIFDLGKYNNAYHRSICKKPVDTSFYGLPEGTESK